VVQRVQKELKAKHHFTTANCSWSNGTIESACKHHFTTANCPWSNGTIESACKHHFTTANCPSSNGTIESACKQVIRAFRAVLSELKVYADEWPEVVNMVQSFLNNSLSTRLNKRTPMQVFTGHAETTSLGLMLKDNVPVNAPLDFIKAQNLMTVEKLSKAMTEIHTGGRNKIRVIAKLLFRSTTIRRRCGRRTCKWEITCL
jgi:hypothetical protein